MKKIMFIGLFIGTLAVGMVIGAYIGARLTSRAFARMEFSKPEIDMAFNAAQEAEWLAELRLNEPKSVINGMESSMDAQVETLATWDLIAPADENTRKARDRWLVAVKVYRESYPASGDDMARANELLSAIPDRDPKSTCKNGVCRLDDLRLAKLQGIPVQQTGGGGGK
jgi:hypothetical protein